MDMHWIMCGEAEHQLSGEQGQLLRDPALTRKGIQAVSALKLELSLSSDDAIVTGTVKRLLQTASLLGSGSGCGLFVHPLAGPRQHPFIYDFRTMPCDRPMEPERIVKEYPEMLPAPGLPEPLWLQGTHTMPGPLFAQQAERFVDWCRSLNTARLFVVTETGTIKAFQTLKLRASQPALPTLAE
ncbi:histidine phosphatase family protein [Paenibacillus filicis]|uniref:Histidine phosphatase family protein n=1 Tax=Paenibacillus gyeongsangnamensis TaxID=3388067 RepID=A0ABT4Q7F6_9BACL|nr:histidine phosphatase family protein [Paenibacillus filicis]MCZ8512808.1 histidine phosphatase family protein [Paenibacillus filicis]